MPVEAERGVGRSSTVKLTVLLGFLSAFGPFSIDLYLAAFPTMATDMFTSVEKIQLTLAVFFAGLAAGQLLYGPLSDRHGRKGPLLAGLVLYSLASFSMVFVRDIRVFLVLRFLQAVGGSAGMILGRAIVRDSYDTESSAKVFTFVMAVQSIGPVVAPVLGAYVIATLSWGACFVFMTFLGVACFVATVFVLVETLPPEKRIKTGLADVLPIFGSILKNGNFLLMALCGSFGTASIFAFISASPGVLINDYSFTPKEYGWIFGIFSLAMTSMSQANYLLLKKFPARRVLTMGIVSMLFFSLLLTLSVEFRGLPPPLVLLVLLFFSLMTMPMIGANHTAIAMSLGGARAGSASSVLGCVQSLTAALVSSAVGLFAGLVSFPMSFAMVCCSFLSLVFLRVRDSLYPAAPEKSRTAEKSPTG
ncbi:MAG: multidrug effflux MFS transporter [Deltaproteobacteria bacterium]|jgi:DHA1 family bicyclomycin/chloramphenicol resistance-like MFS transporter|nr:multidrug effflux MFS transporter [Deltaproteobacteria bacterium]